MRWRNAETGLDPSEPIVADVHAVFDAALAPIEPVKRRGRA